MRAQVLYPGLYAVRIFGQQSESFAFYEYKFEVTSTPVDIFDDTDEFEPDNTPAQANVIVNSDIRRHALGNSADRDWFVFRTLDCLQIEIQTGSLQDLFDIVLYSPNLEVIDSTSPEFISEQQFYFGQLQHRLSPGLYYATVESRNSGNSFNVFETASYNFRILGQECEIETIAPIIDLILSE